MVHTSKGVLFSYKKHTKQGIYKLIWNEWNIFKKRKVLEYIKISGIFPFFCMKEGEIRKPTYMNLLIFLKGNPDDG